MNSRVLVAALFLLCGEIVQAALSRSAHELWAQLWRSTPKYDLTGLRDSDIVPASDMRTPNRTVWVITTACLPWMTGTAINPLLRAAYLAERHSVTLLVPWLDDSDQNFVFGGSKRYSTPDEQRDFLRNWLREEANIDSEIVAKLNISFYAARYHDVFHSIFPMGDITALIPDTAADICILEEPEHLNWFKAPFAAKAWTDKFKYVIGIVHTNYIMYSKSHTLGHLKTPVLYLVNQGICRAYCHRIIKLSDALQEFAPGKEVVANVHGVRSRYLMIGKEATAGDSQRRRGGAYFIGKLAWQKGLEELFSLLVYTSKRTGQSVPIDIFGHGPHVHDIQHLATRMNLPVKLHGTRDHSSVVEHRVFVNPSLSEVLCTATMEALAMGKWVICAKHPSNTFFEQFPNCLAFSTEDEFVAALMWALHRDPPQLTEDQQHALSWEAATERLFDAATMTKQMQCASNSFSDKFFAWMLEMLGGGRHGDAFRQLLGAKSAANQNEYTARFGGAHPKIGSIV